MTTTHDDRGTRVWLTPDDGDLDTFRSLVERTTDPHDHPLADDVRENVPVYGDRLREQVRTPEGRRAAQAEIARTLATGPGIVVIAGAFDAAVVDRATVAFEAMIAEQKASGAAAGDHFAPPGANDRVWGALDKLALRDPRTFVAYYANDVLALVSEAWLGPGYQVTSQVNVVNPGGAAQEPHRDYHLGFMTPEQAAAYPAHAHRLSPFLTLQGAVAHCHMPVEAGPTMYLPFSQTYEPGYVAFHRPEFARYFAERHVQLPLQKGDAVFFNPALMHGAGTNRSADLRRTANLLQVSSAFGRAMETVTRTAMCRELFPALLELRDDEAAVRNAVAASAEGYAFPTNLDLDPPVDGNAPPTQADIVRQAVREGWDPDTLAKELDTREARRGRI
jgi:ectoine hydroxylase-related dioxygenase (phytanoyl-CoA dioxygenase family)